MSQVPGLPISSGRPLRQRTVRRAALLIVAVVLAILAAASLEDTLEAPLVRRTTVTMPGLAPGTAPITMAWLTDPHVAIPDMPPSRLARIVAQTNALHPDIVALGGDYLGSRAFLPSVYSPEEAIRPFAALKAPLGVYAVVGNHDFQRPPTRRRARGGPVRLPPREEPRILRVDAALARAGVTELRDNAVRAGPLAIGGIGLYRQSRQASLEHVAALVRQEGGAGLILSHAPMRPTALPPDIPLLLAGHTHCGQIRLPLLWRMIKGTDLPVRYTCGRVDEKGRTLIVSAGLGTSRIPLRFDTQPEIWLITLVPPTEAMAPNAKGREPAPPAPAP